MMETSTILGFSALFNLTISVICILFMCWLLIQVKIEAILRTNNPFYARLLLIVFSVVLGHQLAGFFIDYFGWSRMLGSLVS